MIGLIHATAAGRTGCARLAAAWPDRTRRYEGAPLRESLRRAFAECDQLVVFLATGAAVRLLAPLLTSKTSDPAVVTVDEAHRHAVALLGGHAAGANALAADVASVLAATPVVTTATDTTSLWPLDTLPYPAEGAIPAVTRAMLDSRPVHLLSNPPWPLPPLPTVPVEQVGRNPDRAAATQSGGDLTGATAQPSGPELAAVADNSAPPKQRTGGNTHPADVAAAPAGHGSHTVPSTPAPAAEPTHPAPPHNHRPTHPAAAAGSGMARTGGAEPASDRGAYVVRVTDRVVRIGAREVVVRPPSLVVGVGASRGVSVGEVVGLVRGSLEHAGLSAKSVAALASVDAKAEEPGIVGAAQELGVELWTYSAESLAELTVPNPSPAPLAAVGTPSVAEASALRAAGPGGELVVQKRKSAMATVAVARRRPRGRLALIGLGPGARDLLTPRAAAELRRASIIVGLHQYVEQIRDLLAPGTRVLASGLGAEEARARTAVAQARAGHAVALIGSGDAGVYAMASPALAEAADDIDVIGVPGVTAALAASALLGAPLGHDHAAISLSDLHTPWEVIERRVRAAAEADLVVTFYNPRSRGRTWQLPRALALLAEHRAPGTPVGVVRSASRPDEHVTVTTLADLDPATVDMVTVVTVGNTATRTVAGRIVTPRGYRWATPTTPLERNAAGPSVPAAPSTEGPTAHPERPAERPPAPPAHPAERSSTPTNPTADRPPTEEPSARHAPQPHRTPHPIEAESFRILRARLDTSHLPPLHRAVLERVVHASADLGYAQDLIADEAQLAAAHAALRSGAPVVADVEMVAAGITARRAVCRLGDARGRPGLTRSAHAVRLAYEEVGPGAVWVVGCAPTALEELIALGAAPALVIGLPVGFVGAAESKAHLRASGLPAVSNLSEKGGSAVAAAALNALLYAPPPAPASASDPAPDPDAGNTPAPQAPYHHEESTQ